MITANVSSAGAQTASAQTSCFANYHLGNYYICTANERTKNGEYKTMVIVSLT